MSVDKCKEHIYKIKIANVNYSFARDGYLKIASL